MGLSVQHQTKPDPAAEIDAGAEPGRRHPAEPAEHDDEKELPKTGNCHPHGPAALPGSAGGADSSIAKHGSQNAQAICRKTIGSTEPRECQASGPKAEADVSAGGTEHSAAEADSSPMEGKKAGRITQIQWRL